MKFIVGFSKSSIKIPLLSWVIQKIEDTPYSHTFIKFQKEDGTWWIYEASVSGVRLVPNSEFLSHNKMVMEYETELLENEKNKLISFITTTNHIKYGYLQLFGMAIAVLFRLNKNPFDDKDETYVCSELVSEVLESVLDASFSAEQDLISPKIVQNWLENNKRFGKNNNYL